MHVHLWYWDEFELYLAKGVTTVRDMFGDEGKSLMGERVKQGDVLGPNMYVASPIIDGYPPRWQRSTVITSPDEGERYVKTYKDMGYDFIKVYEKLTIDVYDAIINAAKKENIPVVGHVPSSVSIEKALQSGQSSIEHLNSYTNRKELISMTVENNVWNCPTIVVYKNHIKPFARQKLKGIEYVNPVSFFHWEKMLAYPKEV